MSHKASVSASVFNPDQQDQSLWEPLSSGMRPRRGANGNWEIHPL